MNIADINPAISIFTLNVNGKNTPIKNTDWAAVVAQW
jgi:hypothetical protein